MVVLPTCCWATLLYCQTGQVHESRVHAVARRSSVSFGVEHDPLLDEAARDERARESKPQHDDDDSGSEVELRRIVAVTTRSKVVVNDNARHADVDRIVELLRRGVASDEASSLPSAAITTYIVLGPGPPKVLI